MSLRELQRAFARVVLSPAPDPRDLDALGGPAVRWQIYREMVRGRLHETVSEVLPRTREALTPDGFARHVDRWIAERPPRSRYVRDLALEFAAHLTPRLDDARAAGLLRLECAIIEAVNALDAAGDAGEFEMHLAPVFTPSARFLRLGARVHSAEPACLLVFRAPETHRIETLMLVPQAADVTERMLAGEASAAACAQAVMATLPPEAHEGFAQMLVELLGDYLDRGVIIGSRPA